MSQHLSEREFAAAIVTELTPQERQHVSDCSRCAAELEAFRGTLKSFRGSFRELVDTELARGTRLSPGSPKHAPRHIGLWGLAAALIAMVIAIPAFHDSVVQTRSSAGERAADTNPDALMRSIQAHLSRSVPGPMEPILIFVRNQELDSE